MTKTKYPDGIHSISNEAYHSSEGVSRSALWKLKKSPAHYWHEYLNPDFIKPEPSPALILGNLVHTLVLEPELLHEEFAFLPDGINKRTKAGKEEHESFMKMCEGKAIVTPEMFNQAQLMTNSVAHNEYSAGLFSDAKIELSIYATHEPTGLQYKVRPDSWKDGFVTDLKTTADASSRAFQSSMMSYGYAVQAGMIARGIESLGERVDKFVFQCVEKLPPYAVGTHLLSNEAMQYGINLFDELMVKYAECLSTDRWPAYELRTLELPRYANFSEE
jgi:exodeoxyribonuclease VIII